VEARRRALAQRPSYRRYIAARDAFDRLVGLVLDTISVDITGRPRGDVGCGSSGGCGCGSGLKLPSAPRMARILSYA
ncbi:MAG TPA: hypothetical protein VIL95_04875, partial [Bacillota bacterium]